MGQTSNMTYLDAPCLMLDQTSKAPYPDTPPLVMTHILKVAYLPTPPFRDGADCSKAKQFQEYARDMCAKNPAALKRPFIASTPNSRRAVSSLALHNETACFGHRSRNAVHASNVSNPNHPIFQDFGCPVPCDDLPTICRSISSSNLGCRLRLRAVT